MESKLATMIKKVGIAQTLYEISDAILDIASDNENQDEEPDPLVEELSDDVREIADKAQEYNLT